METLTFDALLTTAAVAMVLIGAYSAVMSAMRTHREERRRRGAPTEALTETVRAHESILKEDAKRLNDMDAAIRIMLRANMAMLSHDINGDSVDKLTSSLDEINRYLIER